MTDKILVKTWYATESENHLEINGVAHTFTPGDKVEIYAGKQPVISVTPADEEQENMTNPEIKVGQKYRVVDSMTFGYPGEIGNGDIVEIVQVDPDGSGISSDEIIVDREDIRDGSVELIEEPIEPSEDVSPAWASSVPVGVETHAQTSTEAPKSIHSNLSAELLWKFIEGSGEYNQHKQFEIKEIPWDVLKESVKILGDYLEDDADTLASSLEIRLMYNGNMGGQYKGTWGASVYQVGYWGFGEHSSGHEDRLLFGVEIVRGI